MNKEIKSVQIEFKASEEGVFSGYAAFFNNIDSYGDIIEPGAFKDTISNDMPNVKVVWNHNWNSVPIGKVISLYEDDKGLRFEAELNNTSLAKDVKEAIKSGAVNKMSIGFTCQEEEYKEIDGETIRFIKKIKLYEISPVNFPANSKADIEDYKTMIDIDSFREDLKTMFKSVLDKYDFEEKLNKKFKLQEKTIKETPLLDEVEEMANEMLEEETITDIKEMLKNITQEVTNGC